MNLKPTLLDPVLALAAASAGPTRTDFAPDIKPNIPPALATALATAGAATAEPHQP